jgi:hypothetical protein
MTLEICASVHFSSGTISSIAIPPAKCAPRSSAMISKRAPCARAARRHAIRGVAPEVTAGRVNQYPAIA